MEHSAARALVLLVVLVPLCTGVPSPRIFRPRPADDSEEIALCTIDVYQGVLALARASTALFWAQKDCRERHHKKSLHGEGHEPEEEERHNQTVDPQLQQQLCAVTVTEVITSLGETAAYLASSGSDCIENVSEGAYCAADMAALVGALGQVSNFAASVNLTCGGGKEGLEEEGTIDRRLLQSHGLDGFQARRPSPGSLRGLAEPAGIEEPKNIEEPRNIEELHAMFEGATRQAVERDEGERHGGSLEEEHKRHVKELIAERQVEIVECVMDVGQAVGSLVRAGLAIQNAVHVCRPRPGNDHKRAMRKKVCTVDIAGIIGSFTFVGEFISFAVSHCPVGEHLPAQCAGDILKLTTALATFVAVGAATPLTCDRTMRKKVDDPGVPPSRRLTLNASGDLLV